MLFLSEHKKCAVSVTDSLVTRTVVVVIMVPFLLIENRVYYDKDKVAIHCEVVLFVSFRYS